jgi:hypothetical protein
MSLSSIGQSKTKVSPEIRFAPAREVSHRTGHGGTAWAPASPGEVKLYQPQDGAADPGNRVADIASRMPKMAGEPEDARLTGGTRSLMRRLSGLNVGVEMVQRSKPVAAQPGVQKVKNLCLTNANVA